MSFAEWLKRRRGSFFGFQSPGYQLAVAALDRYERLVQASGCDHAAQIERVRDALENRIWRMVPYPRYDLGWAELYELRNELCHELPVQRVFGELIEEISDDLDYLTPAELKVNLAELKSIREGFLALLGGAPTVPEIALRARIEALSQLAAQARDAHWLKVNMTRNRLAMMGVALVALLLVVLLVLPPGLRAGLTPDELTKERFYWLILFFGALGGVISSIMDSESVDTRASEYYIYRRLLYLRPFVGAALALVVYIALAAKLIQIKGVGDANAASGDPSTDLSYLVIAFVSGFAERAFVQQLLKVAGAAQSDGTPSAPAPQPPASPPAQN